MAEAPKPIPGTVGWMDLTVPNADEVRDFYAAVAGWQHSPIEMGGYSDYVMTAPSAEKPVGGICHARGGNADQPPVWMIYIFVDDIEASLAEVRRLGGEVVVGPKEMGDRSRYAVVKDPAGAPAALYQAAKQAEG